jgi:hypothetical protein
MDKFKMNEVVGFQENFYTVIGIGRRKDTKGKYLLNDFTFNCYHLFWAKEEDLVKIFQNED